MSYEIASAPLRVVANQLTVDEYERLRVSAVQAAKLGDELAETFDPNNPEHVQQATFATGVITRAVNAAENALARLKVFGELNAAPSYATVRQSRAVLFDLRVEHGTNPAYSVRELSQ